MEELSLQEFVEEQNFANLLENTNDEIFCSFEAKNRGDKIMLYEAYSNPSFKVNDYFNKKIMVKDVICETVSVKNDDGSRRLCPRVILIDDKGKSYQSVSFGVYNSLKRIISIFGVPTWEEPLPIIPKQSGDGKQKTTVLTITNE